MPNLLGALHRHLFQPEARARYRSLLEKRLAPRTLSGALGKAVMMTLKLLGLRLGLVS